MSTRTDERDLEDAFKKYGEVEKINIVYNMRERMSRGYGFLTFYDLESAKEAVERMNGKELDGRNIRVDFSLTKSGHERTPGVYRGSRETAYNDKYRRSRSRSRDRYSRRRSRSRSYDRYRSRRRSRSRSRDRYRR